MVREMLQMEANGLSGLFDGNTPCGPICLNPIDALGIYPSCFLTACSPFLEQYILHKFIALYCPYNKSINIAKISSTTGSIQHAFFHSFYSFKRMVLMIELNNMLLFIGRAIPRQHYCGRLTHNLPFDAHRMSYLYFQFLMLFTLQSR